MLRSQRSVTLFFVAAAMTTAVHQVPRAQTVARFALESTAGLRLHNVTAEPATLQERKGLRIRMAGTPADEQLAIIEGSDFGNGVIEAEIAGAPQAGAPDHDQPQPTLVVSDVKSAPRRAERSPCGSMSAPRRI